MQPGNPAHDPYGRQPPADPTAPPANPYAPPPANPYAPPPANPYGAAEPETPASDPYGQPADPYGEPVDPYAPSTPTADPYGQSTQPTTGQPTSGQPASGQPYGYPGQPASGAPYGYPEQPASGQPYGAPASPAPYDPYAPPPTGQPSAYGQPYPPGYAPQPYGGAPMYPHAGFGGPGGQQNTLGLISMILGIASIPLGCCYLGIPLGLSAVITGWLGKQKADQGLASNSGQALAGLICGGIGLVLGLLYAGVQVMNVIAP